MFQVGDKVFVKANWSAPYSGFHGNVKSVDEGYNYPIEVDLEGVEPTVFYTEAELRHPVGRPKRKKD